MGTYLNHTWNMAIILYCLIFGSAFFVTSTLYAVTLESSFLDNCAHVDSASGTGAVPVPVPVPAPLPLPQAHTTNNVTSPSATSSLDTCEELKEWRLFATAGVIYGIVCFLLGILQLWPICWSACLENSSKKSHLSGNSHGKVFKTVATNIVHTHQRLLEEGKRRQEKSGFWSACFKFTYRTLTYGLMLGLWLTSLIVPIYISLGITNAFHAMDGQFYTHSLTLFTICLLSLTFVILSAIALICVESDFWNSIEISSSYDSQEQKPTHDLEQEEEEEENLKELSKSPTSTSSYV